jgi:hypothetical protein
MMAGRLDMLRFYLARLGKPGLLGVVLLLGSLIFLATVVRSKEALLEDVVRRNEQARQAAASEQARAAGNGDVALHSALAPEAAAALRRLYAAADEAGLELVKGEYRLIESGDARMRRYQFLLPVYGSYADVRQFLAHALNQEPALALASMQLRRDAIESTELDAVLNFTLYLEAAP